LTREIRKDFAVQSGRSGAPMGRAVISSMGADLSLGSRCKLSASALSIDEDLASNADAAVQISLPSRYRFKQAGSVAMEWRAHERLQYRGSWIQNLVGGGSWISVEARMSMPPGIP